MHRDVYGGFCSIESTWRLAITLGLHCSELVAKKDIETHYRKGRTSDSDEPAKRDFTNPLCLVLFVAKLAPRESFVSVFFLVYLTNIINDI